MILPSGISSVWAAAAFLTFIPMSYVSALIDPIEVDGKQFVYSSTKEPFYIRGVDYQPGDSSDVNYEHDPLTDANVCARDILLFQDLGINTIRIYSVNPDLNHDKCMSMLATAGMYLILDVNSPLPNQHLNRYEPWTSYNPVYLEHVFKVVAQFSHYNNTLGFFAGNEVVNDRRSAQYSPTYIKALVGDMKAYQEEHCERKVPIGYSAADDLNYRVPLASYLECSEDSTNDMSVDFYGVNSYQWCGKQTMQTSGYDKLVDAYRTYSKPVFLSEFGCNRVLPRTFEEISPLYSGDMYTTFSGGLVYEYSQEDNNYGLIQLDDDGNAQILQDFHSLKKQYEKVEMPSREDVEEAIANDPIMSEIDKNHSPLCQSKYENLNIKTKIEKGLASSLIKHGVSVEKGEYVPLTEEDMETTYAISDVDGTDWKTNRRIKAIRDAEPISFKDPSESKDDENFEEPKRNSSDLINVSLWCILFAYLLNFMFCSL
ncbi:hypothetical protein HG535_0F02040 [Zygotorulaspora mrakii]|uniref:1,3-beta-glucanosyltransferase n=1 Tax=Zygotorulaspora mrakii TaxID=42260 RepID=A0A7H9B5F5_ZYGMR|nr:uncharacterized protein HG535_0F02040 [Zygotorulaspora mrakii]QLG73693.1 hypothetical protein HG535_0F02040 [Zygotorulaspora mrakii]